MSLGPVLKVRDWEAVVRGFEYRAGLIFFLFADVEEAKRSLISQIWVLNFFSHGEAFPSLKGAPFGHFWFAILIIIFSTPELSEQPSLIHFHWMN